MTKDVVISVKDVEKSFKIYSDKGHTLKERLLFFKQRNSYTRHEVLKAVTLEIEKGEVIGLVGHNGCGKNRNKWKNFKSFGIRSRISS